MKKYMQLIFFFSIVMQCGAWDFLEAKSKKRTRSGIEQDKQGNILYKQTQSKIKSARQQYKKQFTRLADLLNQAEQLGKGVEEHETTTRDLKDFFSNLENIYTGVVDTITGRDELKKQIENLKKINTQFLLTIQAQRIELDKRRENENSLTQALAAETAVHKVCSTRVNLLEEEKSVWLGYLKKLENCSHDLNDSLNQYNNEKNLTEEVLASLCKVITASSVLNT